VGGGIEFTTDQTRGRQFLQRSFDPEAAKAEDAANLGLLSPQDRANVEAAAAMGGNTTTLLGNLASLTTQQAEAAKKARQLPSLADALLFKDSAGRVLRARKGSTRSTLLGALSTPAQVGQGNEGATKWTGKANKQGLLGGTVIGDGGPGFGMLNPDKGW
jgi:hypothetical protein